jgi:hypothetical protein
MAGVSERPEPEERPVHPPAPAREPVREAGVATPVDAAALQALDATGAVIAMQRTAGNRKVTRWIERTGSRAAAEGPGDPPEEPDPPDTPQEPEDRPGSRLDPESPH